MSIIYALNFPMAFTFLSVQETWFICNYKALCLTVRKRYAFILDRGKEDRNNTRAM
jgi:hypothetical protein